MFLRAVILLPLLSLVLQAQEATPTYKPVDSVVKVVAISECSERFMGSGVVVAPGIIVTSAHGVQGCSEIVVHKQGMTYAVSHHILAADLDLCLLKVPGLLNPSAILYEDELPPLGSPITAIGFPRGVGPITTKGELTAYWQIPNSQLLQSSAEVHPGNSGGGIFTSDGRLLGITSFVLIDSQSFNVNVPSKWIPQLLRRTWQEGRCIMVCRPKELITQNFIDQMTEEPANHKAWEAFSRAWVAKSPKDADAWYSLAQTLSQRLMKGDMDSSLVVAAQSAYQKAIELNPAHVRTWNNLGALYISLGQDEKAIHALRRAVDLKEDYGLAWLNLGAAYLNLRKFEEASQAYGNGLSRLPSEASQWASLAFCEAQMGRMDAAVRHVRIALRHQPTRLEWWKDFSAFCNQAKRKNDFHQTFSELQARLPDFAKRIQKEIKGE